jgi:hypothetical protein
MDSLTMLDLGDCCPAQARYLLGKNDLKLMFCIHHFRKNEVALLNDGWSIIISNLSGLEKPTTVTVG